MRRWWCSVLRVGQGSPCHDFGGALRVTDGQSGEGPRAVGSPSSLGAPTLTARRHARQSRRLRDRAPPDCCARPRRGQARRPGQRRGASGRGSVGGAGDCDSRWLGLDVWLMRAFELDFGEIRVEVLAAGERCRRSQRSSNSSASRSNSPRLVRRWMRISGGDSLGTPMRWSASSICSSAR